MKYKYWSRLALAVVTSALLIIGGREWNLTSQPISVMVQAQTPPPETTEPADEPLPLPEEVAVPAVDISSESLLPLAEDAYQDAANRFAVGILEGFRVTSVGGSVLFESPDGNLAYTVVVQPLIERGLISESELGRTAINAFENGEGFTPQPYFPIASGGIVIPWTGSLTLGNRSQPISGKILARQTSDNVLLLLISATETQTDQLDSALATLLDTLEPK